MQRESKLNVAPTAEPSPLDRNTLVGVVCATLSRSSGCTHWFLFPLWPLSSAKRRAGSVAVESGWGTAGKIDAAALSESGKWRELCAGDEGVCVCVSTVRKCCDALAPPHCFFSFPFYFIFISALMTL